MALPLLFLHLLELKLHVVVLLLLLLLRSTSCQRDEGPFPSENDLSVGSPAEVGASGGHAARLLKAERLSHHRLGAATTNGKREVRVELGLEPGKEVDVARYFVLIIIPLTYRLRHHGRDVIH